MVPVVLIVSALAAGAAAGAGEVARKPIKKACAGLKARSIVANGTKKSVGLSARNHHIASVVSTG